MDSHVRRTVSDDGEVERSLEIGQALELIGEVRRCRPMQTLVHENSELELDPLWDSQPMQLPTLADTCTREQRLFSAYLSPTVKAHT